MALTTESFCSYTVTVNTAFMTKFEIENMSNLESYFCKKFGVKIVHNMFNILN